MKNYQLILFMLLLTSWSVAQSGLESSIEKLLKKELKKKNVHNAYLSIHSPSKSIDLNYVMGAFESGTPVTNENPFHTASIGKTFTAVAVAMLIEDRVVNWSDPISRHLSDSIVNGIHILDDVDYSYDITIAQLLQHTSGLPDYFEGETKDGSPNMLELIFKNPDKFWEPHELLAYARNHMKSLFKPGNGYNYTDTEYILLGLMIEQVTGMSLDRFFEEKIFEPLSMDHTYLYARSTPKLFTDPMAELYVAETDISKYTSLSADWSGGAVVSTGAELVRFQEALMTGELIKPETLQAMQEWVDESKGMQYGFGLRKINFKDLFPTLPDWDVIGHSGLNGTSMYYCPQLDTYIAGTLNQTEEAKGAVLLMIKVLMKINKSHS